MFLFLYTMFFEKSSITLTIIIVENGMRGWISKIYRFFHWLVKFVQVCSRNLVIISMAQFFKQSTKRFDCSFSEIIHSPFINYCHLGFDINKQPKYSNTRWKLPSLKVFEFIFNSIERLIWLSCIFLCKM